MNKDGRVSFLDIFSYDSGLHIPKTSQGIQESKITIKEINQAIGDRIVSLTEEGQLPLGERNKKDKKRVTDALGKFTFSEASEEDIQKIKLLTSLYQKRAENPKQRILELDGKKYFNIGEKLGGDIKNGQALINGPDIVEIIDSIEIEGKPTIYITRDISSEKYFVFSYDEDSDSFNYYVNGAYDIKAIDIEGVYKVAQEEMERDKEGNWILEGGIFMANRNTGEIRYKDLEGIDVCDQRRDKINGGFESMTIPNISKLNFIGNTLIFEIFLINRGYKLLLIKFPQTNFQVEENTENSMTFAETLANIDDNDTTDKNKTIEYERDAIENYTKPEQLEFTLNHGNGYNTHSFQNGRSILRFDKKRYNDPNSNADYRSQTIVDLDSFQVLEEKAFRVRVYMENNMIDYIKTEESSRKSKLGQRLLGPKIVRKEVKLSLKNDGENELI